MAEYKPAIAQLGLNLDNTSSQIPKGQITYALNAQIDNFNGESLTYQNEGANELCVNFPDGYKVIGKYNLTDKGFIIFFLYNPETDDSEIGKVVENTCEYQKLINSKCLNFNINYPIHKVVHKSTSCSTEVYWTDNFNPRRFIDLDNLPFVELTRCPEIIYGEEVDCNKLLVNPNFKIPQLEIVEVDGDGIIEAGTYQFAIQYCDARGEGYTSFYSVTNPTPVFDINQVTLNFDYKVNKSIRVDISNLDLTGYFDHFNLAVIKTVNNISSVELVGTYSITNENQTVVYTGQGVQERFTINDIFEKFPVYKKAGDLTTAQDSLIWVDLSEDERINYQSIATKIKLMWQTWRVNGKETYKNPLNSTYLRGYMRDEVYPVEIVFLLKNGKQTDGFHIPGRVATEADLVPVFNDDVVNDGNFDCDPVETPLPTWQVYNTGSVTDFEKVYTDFLNGITHECPTCPPIYNTPTDDPSCYVGPYQYGEFAYWESEDLYPCTEAYGELANKPIRHHKFPDSLVTHIHDNQGYIYPIGFRVNVHQVLDLIQTSNLTEEQKKNIQGFKIVRGNRVNNKSVIAKGLVHNVGRYQRDEQVFLFPNYPYNDLNQDPFISSASNSPTTEILPGEATTDVCLRYQINGHPFFNVQFTYTDCTDQIQTVTVPADEVVFVCSKSLPTASTLFNNVVVTATGVCDLTFTPGEDEVYNPTYLTGFGDHSRRRYTFHSPDTHFYQPNLGNILKLETAEFGKSRGRFREVKNHSKYKFVSGNAFITALFIGIAVGFASNTVGVSTNVFSGTAAFTAYTSFIQIIDKVIPRKNFSYQYNSIGNYTDYKAIPNSGNKQRRLDISAYLAPGMINIGEQEVVNNYQRESSVYLRTVKRLPVPHFFPGVPEDVSRWVLSEVNCNLDTLQERDISSYYAAIKRKFANQYGQLYSYETIDTGFQYLAGIDSDIPEISKIQSVFGGDIFINRFGYKSKLPFFIDHKVGFPDDSDVFYNELGNVGIPNYWFSTDSTEGRYRGPFGINLGPLFGVKAFNFDCRDNKFFYDSGKIYLFAYGVPYYYCESEVNVDHRQAFNGKEGDFFPRVSSDIPEDWFQEINTSIQQDNTYHYNKTYSKQNKENFFSHIPADFDDCETDFSHRVIFSDPNEWLIYRGNSIFDLPENYGKVTGIDGIEDRAVLVRFENKSLLYNALLTAPTTAGEVYLGKSLFSSDVPPIDYAETDTGYAGSQNKLFIKTEYGHVSTDSKRGKVLLYRGNKLDEITYEGVSKFFTENLSFYISKQFPDYPTDNHFNGVGLHGVYDNKRLIITKLDYEPLNKNITYDGSKFLLSGKEISLEDPKYFANRSFTMSYDFGIKAWVGFHSYLPNFYVSSPTFFYSGKDSLWRHGTNYTEFNKFYGEGHKYVIEYPYSFVYRDEILQCVKDYTKVQKFVDNQSFVEIDDGYFNSLVIYNNQQCSGNLILTKKPKNSLASYNKYPIYNSDSKEILYTKSDNFYQINTFWDMVKSTSTIIWKKSDESTSTYKELNQSNLDYSKRSYKKGPIRGKDLKVRFTLDNRTDIKLISQVALISTQKSFK